MSPAKVTEISRGSAHQRQVAYVRASLLQGIEYGRKDGGRPTRPGQRAGAR
jgi:hypothetical protein